VVRDQQELMVRVALSAAYFSGTADRGFTDRTFQLPTTVAKSGKRVLAVSSRSGARNAGTPPELPLDVSAALKVPR
jgi:hypothetical protein